MSLYVLDTDILTLYQMAEPRVARQVLARPISDLAIAVISVEEQLGSWYTRLRQTKKRGELARVYERLASNTESLAGFRILSYTEQAMQRYDDLRVSHRGVGKNDLRIAAIALENDAAVVTRNRRDFGRVPGLRVEDWST